MRNDAGNFPNSFFDIVPDKGLEEEMILGRMKMAEEPLSKEESLSTETAAYSHVG